MSISNPSIIMDVVNVYQGNAQPWTLHTANHNALPGNRIIADLSASAWAIALPSSPQIGDEIEVLTVGAGTNALTINPNGVNLNGAIAPMQISTDRQETHFIYIGAAGWVAAIGGGTASSPTPTSPYIAEAQLVIDAILATGATLSDGQKKACNDRIVAMKNSGVWAQRLGYYGFLGGTAASHAINWKSPGTLDITWGGSPNHSAQGVQGNSTNAYGDTGFIPSVHGLTTKSHLMFYCRNPQAVGVSDGGIRQSNDQWNMHLYHPAGNSVYYDAPTVNGRISTAIASAQGYTLGCVNDGAAFISKNGTIVASATVSTIHLMKFTRSLWFLGVNADDGLNAFSSREYSSFCFGLELTQDQAIADYASEQNYQTALGRQV